MRAGLAIIGAVVVILGVLIGRAVVRIATARDACERRRHREELAALAVLFAGAVLVFLNGVMT